MAFPWGHERACWPRPGSLGFCPSSCVPHIWTWAPHLLGQLPGLPSGLLVPSPPVHCVWGGYCPPLLGLWELISQQHPPGWAQAWRTRDPILAYGPAPINPAPRPDLLLRKIPLTKSLHNMASLHVPWETEAWGAHRGLPPLPAHPSTVSRLAPSSRQAASTSYLDPCHSLPGVSVSTSPTLSPLRGSPPSYNNI